MRGRAFKSKRIASWSIAHLRRKRIGLDAVEVVRVCQKLKVEAFLERGSFIDAHRVSVQDSAQAGVEKRRPNRVGVS